MPKRSTARARFFVGSGVEHGIRIGVARQEALQAEEIGRAAAIDQQRTGAAILDERDAAQDEGAHENLAELGGADHQRADMRGIEGQRGAAVGTGTAGGERAAAGQRTDLAGELAFAEQDDRRLAVQAVAPDDLDATVEHQPDRRIAHAHVVDQFAGREVPRVAVGEAPGGLHLQAAEHRKELVEAGLEDAHQSNSTWPARHPGHLVCPAGRSIGPSHSRHARAGGGRLRFYGYISVAVGGQDKSSRDQNL